MTFNSSFEGRRDFLRNIAITVSGVFFSAGDGIRLVSGAAAAEASRAAYKPSFFSDTEWAFINAAVDRLIPAGEEGPGAVELGVPEFIDRQMETDYGHGGRWYLLGPFQSDAPTALGYQLRFTPREFYRAAIADIDNWCREELGKDFADLDPDKQDQKLRLLEAGKVDLPYVKAAEFFVQLLNNTKEGYFADPMYGGNRGMGAWKMIGFPGARADFADWMSRPGQKYPLGPVSILGEKA